MVSASSETGLRTCVRELFRLRHGGKVEKEEEDEACFGFDL